MSYDAYVHWLHDRGCIFPSVFVRQLTFPAHFDGIVGVQAATDIGPHRAFLFVPLSATISISTVLASPLIQVIEAFPELFINHDNYEDRAIISYMVYERLKGSSSQFAPYFDVITEPEILSDWSDIELEELQDHFLAYTALQVRTWTVQDWVELAEAYSAFPQYFSGVNWNVFYWAEKAFKTRCFEWAGFRLVPLADALNHANVNVVYEVRSADFLTQACVRSVDYSDFSGISTRNPLDMPSKTCRNRLTKYLADSNPLPEIRNIWEIETFLEGYDSSSDSADSDTSEESGEESEEQEAVAASEEAGQFFVMRTRLHSSFAAGSQVYNCYGRLSNADLLLNYGFAMPANEYDSFQLRLWKDAGCPPHSLQFAEEQYLAKKLAKQKLGTVYSKTKLKLKQLSLELLAFFRTTEDVGDPHSELNLVKEVIAFMESLIQQRRTTLRVDSDMLNSCVPGRLRSALVYRHKQKLILHSHVKMLRQIAQVIQRVIEGVPLSEAHLPRLTSSGLKKNYPLRLYLQALNLKLGS